MIKYSGPTKHPREKFSDSRRPDVTMGLARPMKPKIARCMP